MVIQPKHIRHYLPPKDHLAAIGAIAATWSIVESVMETTILGLYEIDLGRGLVLTNNLSFHARLSLLRILAGETVHMTAAQSTEMKAILDRLDADFGQRNKIIHGLWGPSDRQDVARRLSIRARGKKLVTASQNYRAADLLEVADRLSSLATDFADLGHRLGLEALLAAAPRHSGEPPRKSTSK
jgi:hypothetical protein